eukprot:4449881-Alexandrium_andersonii.AAC.1
MCIRDRAARASFAIGKPEALPNELGRHECRRDCAEAWRTSLAGKPPGGALRTHPHRHRREGAPCGRQ